jgi:hypothetical protein
MALGIVMVFEGIPYFTAPDQMKELMSFITKMENPSLRMMGFVMMMGGLLLLGLSKL